MSCEDAKLDDFLWKMDLAVDGVIDELESWAARGHRLGGTRADAPGATWEALVRDAEEGGRLLELSRRAGLAKAMRLPSPEWAEGVLSKLMS